LVCTIARLGAELHRISVPERIVERLLAADQRWTPITGCPKPLDPALRLVGRKVVVKAHELGEEPHQRVPIGR
jgi:hypothetical protein